MRCSGTRLQRSRWSSTSPWASSVSGEAPERRRSGRVKLALLAAFFALPVAAGWLVWWLDLAPGTPGNYGTLLQPRPVALPGGDALKGKWVLVQFDGGG